MTGLPRRRRYVVAVQESPAHERVIYGPLSASRARNFAAQQSAAGFVTRSAVVFKLQRPGPVL